MATGELWAAQEAQFPCEFPYEWSSPSAGSPETESEDDYIAGLAERVAHSMLDDDNEDDNTVNEALELKNGVPCFEQDLWASDNGKASMAASPRSTLFGLGNLKASNWRSLSNASSKGSSGVSSQVSSPPSTPLGAQDDTWDLIYAAAEEVVRLRMLEEARASAAGFPVRGGLHHTLRSSVPGLSQPLPSAWGQTYGVQTPPASHANAFHARNSTYSAASSPSNDIAAYMHACNLQHSLRIKAEQENSMQLPTSVPVLASAWPCQAKPVQQHAVAFCRNGQKAGNVQRGHWMADSPSSPWPVSHPRGSGMRAVFLGSNRSGSESCGTGVFLPRRAGSRPDNKKPSMSTVLLPSRIVHALKLNVEDMHSLAVGSNTSLHGFARPKDTSYSPFSPPASNVPGGPIQPTARVGTESGVRMMHPSQSPLPKADSVASLPSEWIY